jgi:hypothetical protein
MDELIGKGRHFMRLKLLTKLFLKTVKLCPKKSRITSYHIRETHLKNTILMLSLFVSVSTLAGPREDAWKLHNRLAGVPPQPQVLDQMSDLISRGNVEGAAELATKHPAFYNVTLKNWIKPWSNRDQTPRIAFNDYVATILGVIRDGTPFDKILYDDVIYVVNSSAIPAYSNTDNNHYRNAESQNLNLKDTLIVRRQTEVTGLPEAAVAGVTTTRNAGENYFSAGTNRRVNRFIFMNYLCKDFEDLHDITIPDFRVARDVERNPGGDSRTYKNRCVGCHAGQDALRGAYAYHNFTGGRLNYTAGQVQGKMNQNSYFPQGFVTSNDSWINLWATGQNAALGWRGETSGNGAASLGRLFASTKAFSSCMARKVFKLVCLKDASNPDDVTFVNKMANEFEANGNYNMKQLIVKTSAGCVLND